MQEPLLTQESPVKLKSKKTVSLLAHSLMKKINIKNELPSVERLPMPLNANFVENTVMGVDYKSHKLEYPEIWNTEKAPRLTDPRQILQGKRGQESQLMPQSNLISRGQIVEKDGQVIIGTTYGKLKGFTRQRRVKTTEENSDQSPSRSIKNLLTFKRKSTKEVLVDEYVLNYSINTVGQKEVKSSLFIEDFLVVQDVTNSIFIYHISSTYEAPRLTDKFFAYMDEQLDTTDIQGYEFKLIKGKPQLIICYLKEIKYYQMNEDFVFEPFKSIETEYQIQQLITTDDQQILFSDAQNNVYLAKLKDKISDVNQIKVAEQNNLVQHLHYSNGIISIVISDTIEKQTILYTVDMSLIDEEEQLEQKKRKDLKKRLKMIENKRKEMDEEDFNLWLLKEKRLQEEKEQMERLERQKQQEDEDAKLPARFKKIFNIGLCTGAQFTKRGQLLLSGTSKFLILSGNRHQKVDFDVIADFQIVKVQFSSNMKYVLALGNDGILREYQWEGENHQSLGFLREANVESAVSSNDGKYFALLSNEQTEIAIYSYEECQVIYQINDLKNAYLLNFTSNSKSLIVVSGTDEEKQFQILVYKIQEDNSVRIVCRQTVDIEEDYITQVEASTQNGLLLYIGKQHSHQTLYIYDYANQKQRLIQRDVMSICLSSDGKLLAYSNSSSQIEMAYILKDDFYEEQNMSRRRESWKQKGNTLKSVNTIQMKDEIAYSMEFYENNQKIAVQTSRMIFGFDVLTHQELYRIQGSQTNNELKKLRVLFDSYLSFMDITQSIFQYDVNYQLDPDYINLITKPLQTFPLRINNKHTIDHSAWTCAGTHFILQMEDQELMFARNPFLHHKVNNELVQSGPFSKIEGFYVPTFMGYRRMGIGSFASIYNYAIEQEKVDMDALSIPIYPYKLNAAHYFAMTGNVRGIEICFEKEINFIQDVFGKTPLDYANDSKDKLIIEAVLKGIFETKPKERTKILRTLRLSTLLANPNSIVANILQNYGAEEPEVVKFKEALQIPKLFPLKDNLYAESGLPVYSADVAKVLHPTNLVKDFQQNRPTSTIVLNNPLPKNFTGESLELLKSISECNIDEIVRTTPVTLFLNRKWNTFGFWFYLYQFTMLSLMLASLTILDAVDKPSLELPCYAIILIGNYYFTLFEMFQLFINGMGYFVSITNMMDITRLILIYVYVYGKLDNYVSRTFILPTIFLLMWFKVLAYLSVFKPTRYLIKMIHEILRDVKTFMIVLFTVMFAYAQITYAMIPFEERNLDSNIRSSYVITLGELGDFNEIPWVNFFIFVLFSFLIPLVLMNMIIALMGDSYTRVQTNAIAADARSLADMLYELEEVVHSLLKIFNPKKLNQEFYFCFQTQINDADGEEDWEGTVGQLKRTIQEESAQLQSVLTTTLTQFVEDITKKNTEKVVDNLLRANQSELDVMIKVQKLVERETNDIRDHVQSKILEESNKVKSQFDKTKTILEHQQQKIIEEFNKTKQQIQEENNKVESKLEQTQEKMEKESRVVKDQFIFTQSSLKDETREMREQILKAYKLIEKQVEEGSKLTKEEIKRVKKKSKIESQLLKEELKKSQTMIDNVSQSVSESGKSIVMSIKQSSEFTAKTHKEIERKKTEQLNQNTEAIQKLVERLEHTQSEQKSLYDVVQEVKEMQNKLLKNKKKHD